MEGLRAGLGMVKWVQSKVKVYKGWKRRRKRANRASVTASAQKRGEVKDGTR